MREKVKENRLTGSQDFYRLVLMNRIKIISILLLLLFCVLLLVSCKRKAPLEKKAINVEQVNELISAARDRLGESRITTQAIFGEPLSSTVEKFTNAYNSKQVDRIHTLTYKGVVVRIYEIADSGHEMLISVRMTLNQAGMLPELIGLNKEAIIAKLGSPPRVDGTAFEYVPVYEEPRAENKVFIEFSKSVVSAVEWDYYID